VANIDVALLVVAAASPDATSRSSTDAHRRAAGGDLPHRRGQQGGPGPAAGGGDRRGLPPRDEWRVPDLSPDRRGVDALREALAGSVHALSGPSGAGKSTLINRLYGLRLETGQVSRIERGRHTTRHSELIPLPAAAWCWTPPASACWRAI
jgi:hypothetical protein